jgi:hypothetical protein
MSTDIPNRFVGHDSLIATIITIILWRCGASAKDTTYHPFITVQFVTNCEMCLQTSKSNLTDATSSRGLHIHSFKTQSIGTLLSRFKLICIL